MEWNKQISNWQEEIRAAKLEKVRRELKEISVKSIPRAYSLSIANICRRTQMFATAIEILHPVVRKNEIGPEASSSEVAEYAASLIRMGSVKEARALLDSIKKDAPAEVYLYKAFSHIVEWDYPAVIPLLEAYIEHDGLSEYQVLVAKMNLASAFVETHNWDRGDQLLRELCLETEKGEHRLLLLNCWNLLLQFHAQREEYDLARSWLEKSRTNTPREYELLHLHLDKWEAFIKRDKDSLLKVQRRALELKEYETLRDCDFALARIFQDSDAAIRYYNGTPHEILKKRAIDFGLPLGSFASFIRHGIGHVDVNYEPSPFIFELENPKHLKSGQVLHRALCALNLDLYRPQTFGGFHQSVFPSSYFDPYSVPNRIHQIVHRLRDWMSEQKFNWTVHSDKGYFEFSNSSGPAILLSAKATVPLNQNEILLKKLFERFGQIEFSAAEAMSVLKCSKAKAQSVLFSAQEAGRVSKTGRARYTEYRFNRAS